MSISGHVIQPRRLRVVDQLTDGVCPRCKLTIILGDTVATAMDGRAWHASCFEVMAREWKCGKRGWRK